MSMDGAHIMTVPGCNASLPDLDIDAISRDQAIVDARVANARIVAITKSIKALSSEVVALREELAMAQRDLYKLEV